MGASFPEGPEEAPRGEPQVAGGSKGWIPHRTLDDPQPEYIPMINMCQYTIIIIFCISI